MQKGSYHWIGHQIRKVVFQSWWFLQQFLWKDATCGRNLLHSLESDHYCTGETFATLPLLGMYSFNIGNLKVLRITTLLWKHNKTHHFIFIILKHIRARGQQWEMSSLESIYLSWMLDFVTLFLQLYVASKTEKLQ